MPLKLAAMIQVGLPSAQVGNYAQILRDFRFEEEIGHSAARWTELASIYTTPGFCEVMSGTIFGREVVALLDHLSNNRFEFGTGRGSSTTEVYGFDIADINETKAMWREAIEQIGEDDDVETRSKMNESSRRPLPPTAKPVQCLGGAHEGAQEDDREQEYAGGDAQVARHTAHSTSRPSSRDITRRCHSPPATPKWTNQAPHAASPAERR